MAKVTNSILAWSGLNLSYAGRIEVIKSVLQGIQGFWLGILPIPSTVLDRITSICRKFLWAGKAARVAWSTACLRKDQGGLGFRHTQKWNDALLTKVLWKLHANKEALWCRWIHHVYLKHQSVWAVQPKKDYPGLLKRLLAIRDVLVSKEGTPHQAVMKLQSWSTGQALDTAKVYEYLVPRAASKGWTRIVWNPIIPPKFSVHAWCAIQGRVPTLDRLSFLGIEGQCKLCRRQEESVSHLFFQCCVTSEIWQTIKSWAGLRRNMSTIPSCLKWLGKECKGKSWRNSFSKRCFVASMYYVWECRNRVLFEEYVPDRNYIVHKIKIQVYKVLYASYPHILTC
ncbi:hypothetical protein M9H77_27600 [Catharanthus roseus]|uniref:Uncharacterized protein n=1 Tax=Catharanthus roseus TaxID=4058 RepID=A0ACC0AEE8_CATRO|nr:hypothetical protein M9H77_27600 [Catharanthus roseus]